MAAAVPRADIHAREVRAKLWRGSAGVAAACLALFLVYTYHYHGGYTMLGLSQAVAGTAGFLISASLALSGFCYYFDFLDTKLGYRKYLGLLGFYLALTYAAFLPFLYPARYGYGLVGNLMTADVLLGFGAMALLTLMAAVSNTPAMLALGLARWRKLLRLGYLALLLLVLRAYLLEGVEWQSWLVSGGGLPPPRLVATAVALMALGLRCAMLVSKLWRGRHTAAPLVS